MLDHMSRLSLMATRGLTTLAATVRSFGDPYLARSHVYDLKTTTKMQHTLHSRCGVGSPHPVFLTSGVLKGVRGLEPPIDVAKKFLLAF